nr:TonB-dependent receptor [Bryobacter sp.]
MRFRDLLFFFFCIAGLAQDPRGTITGRVTDSTSAVIADVEVRVVNRDTGVSASNKTNASGQFHIPFLLPGFYTVNAEMPGFKKFSREGVEVRVSETTEVNLALELGAVTETVQVTAETPLLTTTDASQGTVVDAKVVQELPLMGGNPIELALLDPAITNETDLRERRASMTNASSQWSAMGGGAFNNEFQIDGVSNTFSEGNARARVAFNPPQAAIGQFKVMTNPFDASVGNTLGAVVNVSTKGGTNRMQGEAHYYVRNRAFDCTDFFNNKRGTERPVYQDNRFGASLGGPITIPRLYNGRNRTFFFSTFEKNPYTVPASFTGTVPTAAERTGDFSALLALGARYQIYDPFSGRQVGTRIQRDPYPDNIVPASQMDAAGKALANLYPLPNQPGTVEGINNYFNGSSSAKALENYWVTLTRIDHAFSENHRIFFRLNYDSWWEKKNRQYENGIQGIILTRVNRGLALDDVVLLTPNLVLNLRYGITQQDFAEERVTKGYDLASLGFLPGLTGLIDPERATLPRVTAGAYSSYSTWEKGDGINTSLTHNFNFNFTTQRGIHSMRFGGDFRSYRAFEARYQLETAPDLGFSTGYTKGPLDSAGASPIGQDLAAMLLGLGSGSMERPASFALQNLYFAGFLQDDIKLTRRFTLNLGVRYEYESPLTERYDRLVAGFAYDTANPIAAAALANYEKSPVPELPASQLRTMGGLLFAGQTPAGRSPFRSEKDTILPRIGLAWQVTPKMTLRSGYGLFYGTIGVNGTDPIQYGFSQSTPIQTTLDNGLSYGVRTSNPFPNGLLDPAGSSGGLKTYLSQAISYHDLERIKPYAQRWTLSLQQVLPGQFMVETSYVGSRGTRVGVTRAASPVPRELLSTSPVRDQETINYLGQTSPNPYYGLGPFYSRTITRANLLRPYPHFTNVSVSQPVGYNWYHALQVRATRRMFQGMTVQAGYTFAKL